MEGREISENTRCWKE